VSSLAGAATWLAVAATVLSVAAPVFTWLSDKFEWLPRRVQGLTGAPEISTFAWIVVVGTGVLIVCAAAMIAVVWRIQGSAGIPGLVETFFGIGGGAFFGYVVGFLHGKSTRP